MISKVQPDQLELVWPYFLRWVERGLRHGQGDSLAPCDIYRSILSGAMDFWVSHEGEDLKGGMVLEMNQFPRKKVVFVVMLVGTEFESWVDEMEKALLDYRDINGADSIEASCRRGLVKKLLNRGWTQKAVILEAPDG